MRNVSSSSSSLSSVRLSASFSSYFSSSLLKYCIRQANKGSLGHWSEFITQTDLPIYLK